MIKGVCNKMVTLRMAQVRIKNYLMLLPASKAVFLENLTMGKCPPRRYVSYCQEPFRKLGSYFFCYFYCFAKGIEQDFCIKTSTDKTQDWPAGRYCILKHDSCPVGFADG